MGKAASINVRNGEALELLGRIRTRTGKRSEEIVVDLLRREAARLSVAPARSAAQTRKLRALVRRMQSKAKASGVKMTSAEHADGLYDD